MPAAKQCTQQATTSFTKHFPTQQLPIGPDPKPAPSPGDRNQTSDIIDIRSNKIDFNLKDALVSSFDPPDGGARRLPTLLLYDERGLQLFESVRV